ASARLADRAIPLGLAPPVEEVDGAPADAREVLEALLERTVELEVVRGVDRRPHVGGGAAVEVCMAEEAVDLGTRVDEVTDQPAEGGERGAVTIAQARLVEAVDEIVDAFGDRAHQEHGILWRQLLLKLIDQNCTY